jgi:hypothetical protein
VLFASPNGAGSLDLTYLTELNRRGFEIDYTETLAELTSDRIAPFDVVVLFVSPDAYATRDGSPSDPAHVEAFQRLIDEYLKVGGGVLMIPALTGSVRPALSELSDRWGARVAAEQIVETDPAQQGTISRMRHGGTLAFTDQVSPSPITTGVRGVWYPTSPAFSTAMTMPLVLTPEWQVVLRASKTSTTRPLELDPILEARAAPVLRRATPEKAAPLFAVRPLHSGRLAMVAEWPQFSIGAGTKWLYDRAVLERGVGGKPSDFGRLLENCLRWLAAPSLERRGDTHYRMPQTRLEPPNARASVRAQFRAAPLDYDLAALATSRRHKELKLYRGLIGAQTTERGRARWSVQAFAKAARLGRLDFVVFLEPLDQLTPQSLAQLIRDCAANSGPDLLLLAGYSVTSNIGSRMFFFGAEPPFPPDNLLTGPSRRVLYVQQQDASGAFTGYGTGYESWMLSSFHDRPAQIGYYDFGHSKGGVEVPDARQYSAVGLRYFRGGKLIEEVEHDYRLAAAATIAPSPLTVHEVSSPQELLREARNRRGLTHITAFNLDVAGDYGVMGRGLRWLTQYRPSAAFPSSGPVIWEWSATSRAVTYGGEGYAPERSVVLAPLSVSSDVGLKELTLHDGPRLFMRLELGGASAFSHTLVLDANLSRNLILTLRDRAGGTAISYPHRIWPEGALAPIFCSDHVNDCAGMRLARGPWSPPLTSAPAIPPSEAGDTWDGGPVPVMSSILAEDTLPIVTTAERTFDAHRLASIPVLDFADEASVGTRAVRDREYASELKSVINPWHTLGPIAAGVPTLRVTQLSRQWAMRTEGALPTGWAAHAVRRGVSVSMLRSETQVTRALRATKVSLARIQIRPEARIITFKQTSDGYELGTFAAGTEEVILRPGDGFALVGKDLNAHVFFNRESELALNFEQTLELTATHDARASFPGQKIYMELVSHAFALDVNVDEAFLRHYLATLREPVDVTVRRGRREPSPGLFELAVQDGAVEVVARKAPSPATLPLRVTGLNARWSAGVFQKAGPSLGFYGTGANRYRALAVDAEGVAISPLHIDHGDNHVVLGHPITAHPAGEALHIQVTCLGGDPKRWHVSVNNPTHQRIRAVLRQSMDLPGLAFEERTLTLAAGELRDLQ